MSAGLELHFQSTERAVAAHVRISVSKCLKLVRRLSPLLCTLFTSSTAIDECVSLLRSGEFRSRKGQDCNLDCVQSTLACSICLHAAQVCNASLSNKTITELPSTQLSSYISSPASRILGSSRVLHHFYMFRSWLLRSTEKCSSTGLTYWYQKKRTSSMIHTSTCRQRWRYWYDIARKMLKL